MIPPYRKLEERRSEDRGYAEIVTDITTRNPECIHIVGQHKTLFLSTVSVKPCYAHTYIFPNTYSLSCVLNRNERIGPV